MKFSKPLQCGAALLCASVLAIVPLGARTRKGDHFFKMGEAAETAKDYDKAIDYYDQALSTDPHDAGYLLADRRAHAAGATYHIEQGRRLLDEQKLDEAMTQFQKAFLADPGNQVAIQLVRETEAMQKEKARSAPGATILTPAQKAQEEMQKRINALEGPPELKPITEEIRSLKMNNQPARVLYESLGKLAGINVLFDPQGIESVGGKNYNLDLNNITLQEALDYIALETHTFWKPISHNAIFVTQESEPKRMEYQDEVVRVFYIQNASTQAEFTEIFNAVRTGAKLNQGMFQVASQNAIIVRGPVDTVALVEKLVHELDRPKPEVMVDVLVMEVNKNKTTTLGANILGQGGLSVPVNFTPRASLQIPGNTTASTGSTTSTTGTTGTTSTTSTTGTTGTTGTTSTTGTTGFTGTTGTTSTTSTTGTLTTNPIPISNLGHLSSRDFSTTLPGALLQALLSDSSSRVLQRPQIRATDGGKASLKIGSKIPYVSGSLNSAVATPGAIPYATTQFQQVDVGVNVDLEPHVNAPNDVSMHIKVEISNTNGSVNIGGIDEPIITQRVNEANIRMREGEVAILGGLTDLENSLGISGTPGLVNIPVLGYLFGSKQRTRIDDQILVALIPHIVRAPDPSEIEEEPVYAGSDRVVHVRRKQPQPDPNQSLAPTDGTPPGTPPPANQQITPPSSPPTPTGPPVRPNQPGPVIVTPGNPRTIPPNSPPPPGGQPQ